MKKEKPIGFVVTWDGVGMYWSDAEQTLFNGIVEGATLFPTKQAATGAVRRAQRYWTKRRTSEVGRDVYRVWPVRPRG